VSVNAASVFAINIVVLIYTIVILFIREKKTHLIK